ncbi:hypothetical protein [Planomonospora sp. ID82291]|uniref:hypothetical protein n=1 Tax=Planomonospora sp. ID82291 TaxID=2738136 RepID=UPI0018C3F9A6|nr:hypothetical protein [Planomonospora sp. ID82291]MBG0819001.1 hypothetical protein [Planomonospora sp. ID82291]
MRPFADFPPPAPIGTWQRGGATVTGKAWERCGRVQLAYQCRRCWWFYRMSVLPEHVEVWVEIPPRWHLELCDGA